MLVLVAWWTRLQLLPPQLGSQAFGRFGMKGPEAEVIFYGFFNEGDSWMHP